MSDVRPIHRVLARGIEPQVDEKLYFITRYALSKRFAAVIEYISNETTLRFQHVRVIINEHTARSTILSSLSPRAALECMIAADRQYRTEKYTRDYTKDYLTPPMLLEHRAVSLASSPLPSCAGLQWLLLASSLDISKQFDFCHFALDIVMGDTEGSLSSSFARPKLSRDGAILTPIDNNNTVLLLGSDTQQQYF